MKQTIEIINGKRFGTLQVDPVDTLGRREGYVVETDRVNGAMFIVPAVQSRNVMLGRSNIPDLQQGKMSDKEYYVFDISSKGGNVSYQVHVLLPKGVATHEVVKYVRMKMFGYPM